MTDGLFSDPVHVEPVQAPGERPAVDPFHVPSPDTELTGPAQPATTGADRRRG
jgi:hypothetical protein